MLRFVVIMLLLANAGYGAWSQGLLRPWGLAPQEQAEPRRMHQQIRPETLQILKPDPAAPTAPPGAEPPAATGVSTVSAQPPGRLHHHPAPTCGIGDASSPEARLL